MLHFRKSQRIKKKTDSKEGSVSIVPSLESDPEYLAFLEKLKEPLVILPSAEEQLDRRLALEREQGIVGQAMPIVTPLILYLREKRALKASKGRDRRKKVKEIIGQDKKAAPPKEKKANVKRTKKRDEKSDDPKAKGDKEDKRGGRNGVWMVRKQMEPGAVSILSTKEKPSAESPVPASTPQANSVDVSQQMAQNPGGNPRKPRNDNTRPDRRKNDQSRMKVYAPKQRTPDANPQAVKVTGNQ